MTITATLPDSVAVALHTAHAALLATGRPATPRRLAARAGCSHATAAAYLADECGLVVDPPSGARRSPVVDEESAWRRARAIRRANERAYERGEKAPRGEGADDPMPVRVYRDHSAGGRRRRS